MTTKTITLTLQSGQCLRTCHRNVPGSGTCSCGWAASPDGGNMDEQEWQHMFGDLTGAARRFVEAQRHAA